MYACYLTHFHSNLSLTQFSVTSTHSEWKEKVLATRSCLSHCNPLDCSPPGSYVHGILQARILGWLAISFSRGPSWPRGWTRFSRIAGRLFTARETPLMLINTNQKKKKKRERERIRIMLSNFSPIQGMTAFTSWQIIHITELTVIKLHKPRICRTPMNTKSTFSLNEVRVLMGSESFILTAHV